MMSREEVLGTNPDLVISEFANDSVLGPEQVESKYGLFLEDFGKIGAERVISTPHYVSAGWMGPARERGSDDDPPL